MIKIYLKIAWRNLTKYKLYSIINITGLSVGVACTLIILMFVSNEMSFDDFHENSENIYKATRHGKLGDNQFEYSFTPAPLAAALINEIPEVEKAVRFRGSGTWLVRSTDMETNYKEHNLIYADSNVFDFFTFPLLEGDIKTALNAPNKIAISKKIADKYFADQSALNQTLILDGEDNFIVSAVYKDMPENSHIKYDFMMSMATISGQAGRSSFVSNNFYTYFSLREDADPNVVERKINDMVKGYVSPELQKNMGKTLDEIEAQGDYLRVDIMPLSNVYLDSNFNWDIGLMGSRDHVYIFSAIALFIIVLACINFMNLSTARSVNRAKEVGVRKSLGSHKIQLINQFLTESIIMSIFSFALGLILMYLALPLFNQIADKSLILPVGDPSFIVVFIMSSILIGILAGLYPAFYLSSFTPIQTLKGKIIGGSGNSNVRSGLVIFQFMIGMLLIMGTLAINKQLKFIQNKDIGFNKEQVIIINDLYMLGKNSESFKNELDQLNNVKSSSISGYLPINGFNRSENSFWKGGEEASAQNTVSMQVWNVDEDYIETMGMDLISGRNLNKELSSDSKAIILNETALRRHGFEIDDPEPVIQQQAYDPITYVPIAGEFNKYRVVGVVKDFHFESMKDNVGPVLLRLGNDPADISVRVQTDDFSGVLAEIENLWKKFDPSLPFNYSYLDEEFEQMYMAESKLSTAFSIFAGLAIFIACLGLFALASFMTEQRKKEIGIRKVLGASVKGVVIMLSSEFSRLVLLSFLFAIPIGWWVISHWLSNYNYKVEIGWQMFIVAGLSAFMIAWITVSYHSIKVAISNPASSLKSE